MISLFFQLIGAWVFGGWFADVMFKTLSLLRNRKWK